VALAAGAVSTGGCSGGSEQTAPPPKTITVQNALDPASCRDCHVAAYEQWLGSMHAYAADDPVFIAMNRRGQEETNGELGSLCVSCHAPMAVRTGATTDGLNLEEVPQYLKGVTCYFCHSVDAVEGTHNNPLRLADDLVMRGGIVDPVDNPYHESAYSELLDGNQIGPSSSMCGSCHDVVLDNDVHLERTYLEWQESIFGNGSPGGLSCNDCHMPSQPGPVAIQEGMPERTIHDHLMPGVDVALTPWPNSDLNRSRVERELFGAIIGQICVLPPLIATDIEVTLDNAFSGHSFPSGAAHDRRVWVEVMAYDENDALVYSVGDIDEGEAVATRGKQNPELWEVRDFVFGPTDDPDDHFFWEIARYETALLEQADSPTDIHSQTRIFSVPLNAGAVSRATLRVRIRPMGREILEDLVSTGHLAAEIVDRVPTFEVVGPVEWRLDRDGYGCVPESI
ncbi:MAG: multiheme c-type cytochrome, partial [Myxococcota bacterium]